MSLREYLPRNQPWFCFDLQEYVLCNSVGGVEHMEEHVAGGRGGYWRGMS